jgi:hypothetical protein
MASSRPPSPLSPSRTALLEQLEKTLNSPSTFSPTTPHLVLAPLLLELRSHDDDDDGRISALEECCRHLADATTAAEARDTVHALLAEVEDWDDWRWDADLGYVDGKRGRIEGIKATLSTLPIEWLKARVTGTSSS